jgi:hypothetical protein
MSINRQYAVINKMFKLSGVTEENEIEPFKKGKNYAGFSVHRKL